MKCQCPRPDYIVIPLSEQLPHYKTFTEVLPDDLHGCKATTECEHCGIGLCDRCSVKVRNWKALVLDNVNATCDLCPACAEEVTG